MEFLPTQWLTDGVSDFLDLSKCDGTIESSCDSFVEDAVNMDTETSSSNARLLYRMLDED